MVEQNNTQPSRERARETLPDKTPPDLPRKPNGKRWAKQHWRAAWLRAGSVTWIDVAEIVDYSINTVTNYSRLDGWSDLVDWCDGVQTEQVVKSWMDGEERREVEGLEIAFAGLMKLMRGEPIGVNQKPPSCGVSLAAITAFGEYIGYTQVKTLIAERRALALLEEMEFDEVDDDTIEVDTDIIG